MHYILDLINGYYFAAFYYNDAEREYTLNEIRRRLRLRFDNEPQLVEIESL